MSGGFGIGFGLEMTEYLPILNQIPPAANHISQLGIKAKIGTAPDYSGAVRCDSYKVGDFGLTRNLTSPDQLSEVLTVSTLKRSFFSPIAAISFFFVSFALEDLKVTFWVPFSSPALISMSLEGSSATTPSSFLNAARTYFLQPPHVTPDIPTV